ncbi:hypothetical protein [Thermithiobacillus plumbiphilus]|uniref:DUF3303 domain-containing protein n=1 Tax=Thermithiobacillus plumbiphilus TaxID=1729899 RepID=A0ABU9DAR0_9PROT
MKYFVVYRWKYEGRDYSGEWHVLNQVMESHPVDELIRWLSEGRQGYSYQLMFWSEIPDDVYERARQFIDVHGEVGD